MKAMNKKIMIAVLLLINTGTALLITANDGAGYRSGTDEYQGKPNRDCGAMGKCTSGFTRQRGEEQYSN